MTQLELVRAVLAYYGGDATRWTQKAFARNRVGEERPARSDDAVCACLIGIALRLDGDNYGAHHLTNALGFSTTRDMVDWQDNTGRTFAEVEQRLREAETRLAKEHAHA